MATKKLDPQTQNKSTGSPNTHSNSTCCDPNVLRARIDGAAQAQKRSRTAFLASTIMSLAILIAMWNAYFSWYRGFLFKASVPSTNITLEAQKTPEVQRTLEAQKTLIDEWVRNREITMPILGIKAGVGDGAVVGSVSLYVICIWVLLSMRRENHIIGILLNDTTSCPESIRNIVFHGIVAFAVFTTVSNFDAPIKKLNQQPTESRSWLTRGTYKILIALPAITIFLIMAMDVISIRFLGAPFREGNQALWWTLTREDWTKRAFMEAVCLLLLIPTAILCVRTIGYNDGTQSVLQEYEKGLSST